MKKLLKRGRYLNLINQHNLWSILAISTLAHLHISTLVFAQSSLIPCYLDEYTNNNRLFKADV